MGPFDVKNLLRIPKYLPLGFDHFSFFALLSAPHLTESLLVTKWSPFELENNFPQKVGKHSNLIHIGQSNKHFTITNYNVAIWLFSSQNACVINPMSCPQKAVINLRLTISLL